MTTTLSTTIKISILLAVSLFVAFSSQHAHARSVNESCKKIETVFARGSGQNTGGDEFVKFSEELNDRLGPELRPNHYELGTESYGGSKYPAVNVDFWNGNAVRAWISGGKAYQYGKSVRDGSIELLHYLSDRYIKCKNAGSYFVLGGYSQGAHVIGNTLPYLSQSIRDRIVFVGLFGDPKLYFPEGYGSWPFDIPPACEGKEWSPYRRTVGNCWLSEGRLGARKPLYVPEDMKWKTGLWCHADDFVCGTSHNPFAGGHGTYANEGGAIDRAAQETAARISNAIALEPQPTPPSNPTPNPTPPPPAPLINTSYRFGMGLNGQDVVYLVDISNQMIPHLEKVRENLKTTIPKIIAKGGRVALFLYTGYSSSAGGLPFGLLGSDAATNAAYIDTYVQGHPSIIQGEPLSALNSSMLTLPWNYGAAKSIILLTNKTPIGNPDSYGMTRQVVAKTSLAIDPVNIYPIVPEEHADDYTELAELTSGQVTTFTDDIGDAMDISFDKTQNRPVPFLKNTTYISQPGREITFDASDSYVLDSTITQYEWDFDGDGTFETTTTGPIINHTYQDLFDGYMQVRVSAANGTIANMSAIVKIGTYEVPVFASAPTNFKATYTETSKDKGHVKLSWQPPQDGIATKLMLSINGISVGTITLDQTSITVTDIDRSIDYDFSLTGMASDDSLGHSTYTTLASLNPLYLITSSTQQDTASPANQEVPIKLASSMHKPSTDDSSRAELPQSIVSLNDNPIPAWLLWAPIPLIILCGVFWKFHHKLFESSH